MKARELESMSKFLSLVLRHKPKLIGVKMDKQGWVDTKELCEKCQDFGKDIDLEFLYFIVADNEKKRFTFNADKSRIRANQGHSIDIDLGYEPTEPPKLLFHGTAELFLDGILRNGLVKRKRRHVHLSPDEETAFKVGSRHGQPIILTILAKAMHKAGHIFYISENGVWLTDEVPPEFILLDF